MSDKDKLAETAEFYDTHDTSAEMQAGEWSRHEGKQPETAMSGFNTRLPTAVLTTHAPSRGPGAWIREAIEAAVARQKEGATWCPCQSCSPPPRNTSTAGPLDQLTGR